MKFKERLWQLFLAIVLGVTLSVCDAGLQDDELESSALVAGSAIAAGVTSGDNWLRIGNYQIVDGSFNFQDSITTEQIPKSFNSNMVFFFGTCLDGSNNYRTTQIAIGEFGNSFTPQMVGMNDCHSGRLAKYQIIGKF